MKNYKKGVIVPIVWGIVALLTASLGTYIYIDRQHKTLVANQIENNVATTSDSSTNQVSSSTQNQSKNPIINSISPSSASIDAVANNNGIYATITGTGFSLSDNTVFFGNQNSDRGSFVIHNLSSTDGKTIKFQVPMDILYGASPVSMQNLKGNMSNSVDFTLTQPNSTQNQNSSSSDKTKLSDTSILNAINAGGGCSDKGGDSYKFTKVKDYYNCENRKAGFNHSIGKFAYGDLNADRYEDAIAVFTTCGGSCGNNLVTVINQKNGSANLENLTVPGYLSSGAGQTGVENISIKNGVISIEALGWEDSNKSNGEYGNSFTKDFYLNGNKLIEIKDSTQNKIVTLNVVIPSPHTSSNNPFKGVLPYKNDFTVVLEGSKQVNVNVKELIKVYLDMPHNDTTPPDTWQTFYNLVTADSEGGMPVPIHLKGYWGGDGKTFNVQEISWQIG